MQTEITALSQGARANKNGRDLSENLSELFKTLGLKQVDTRHSCDIAPGEFSREVLFNGWRYVESQTQVKTDLMVRLPSGLLLAIEAKNQQVKGTADEKLFAVTRDMQHANVSAMLCILSGRGARVDTVNSCAKEALAINANPYKCAALFVYEEFCESLLEHLLVADTPLEMKEIIERMKACSAHLAR